MTFYLKTIFLQADLFGRITKDLQVLETTVVVVALVVVIPRILLQELSPLYLQILQEETNSGKYQNKILSKKFNYRMDRGKDNLDSDDTIDL